MALESTFRDLQTQLNHLREAFVGLHTTITEDKPLQDDVVLVDLFGDVVDDVLGWLDGALTSVNDARQAVTHPVDLNRAWRALVACHEQVQNVQQRFAVDLIGYKRITELTRFGQRRGGEWQAWATSIRTTLDHCQQLLFAVGQAIFRCWQEVAERNGINSVLAQSWSIG